MDKALDDIIGERRREPRQRGPRSGPSGPRDRRAPPREHDSGPRDGIKKDHRLYEQGLTRACLLQQYQRDGPRNLDKDWVHDKWNDDEDDSRRPQRRDPYSRHSRSPERRRPQQSEAKLRVENIHFELLEPDLRELFGRIGALQSVQLLYDRQDRATGTAFVTYHSVRDAEDAVREFDGANAYGQPIRVRLQAPRDERPARSLFDRIDNGDRRRPARSISPLPRKDIDRYVPGGERRERSPRRPRAPREAGRRPGERPRGRGDRKPDGEGQKPSGRRPRKTAEELDAEMNDYWNAGEGAKADVNGAPAPAPVDKAPEADIDIMVE